MSAPFLRTLVAAVLLVTAACGGDGGGTESGDALEANAPRSGPDVLPDEDLDLGDEVIVVRGNDGQTVRSFERDGRTVVLDSGVEGVGDLAPGSILLLTGMFVAKVAEVTDDGDDTRVTLEPAGIAEVIHDGELSWSEESIDLSQATLRTWDDTGEAQARGLVGGWILAAPAAQGGSSISGSVGGYDYELTPSLGEGTLFVDGTVSRDSGLQFDGTLHVEVTAGTADGGLSVDNGVLERFDVEFPSLRGKVTFELSAAAQDVLEGLTAITIPMSVEVPVIIGGIPFRVGFGAELSVEPVFSQAEAGISGKVEIDWDGGASLTASGSLSGTSDISSDVADTISSLDGASVLPVALIIKTEFPKLSFGIGMALASAGATLDLVTSFGPTYSGSLPTGLRPDCFAMPVNVSLNGGISVTFIGQEYDVMSGSIISESFDFFRPDIPACRF